MNLKIVFVTISLELTGSIAFRSVLWWNGACYKIIEMRLDFVPGIFVSMVYCQEYVSTWHDNTRTHFPTKALVVSGAPSVSFLSHWVTSCVQFKPYIILRFIQTFPSNWVYSTCQILFVFTFGKCSFWTLGVEMVRFSISIRQNHSYVIQN